ncbi:MAG: hypothetical protein U0Q16_20675 [Bryobacteraceae bacterium]
MNTIIEIPDDRAAAYQREAQSHGLTLEGWLLQLADSSASTALLARGSMNREAWVQRFRAWADSHDPCIPVLSDDAMSRESIYPDPA